MPSADGWILYAFTVTFRFLKLTIQLNAWCKRGLAQKKVKALHITLCYLLVFDEYPSFMNQAWIHYLTSVTLILTPIGINP